MVLRKRTAFRVALIIVAVLIIIFLLFTVVLHTMKSATHDSVFDVWRDIGLLLSQRNIEPASLSHKLNCLSLYLTSNTLDGLMHEWRTLNALNSDLGAPIIQYIYWEGTPLRFDPREFPQNEAIALTLEPVNLFIVCSKEVQFNHDSAEFDYTLQEVSFELNADLLCPQNESGNYAIGYASELIITHSISTPKTGTVQSKNVYSSSLMELFDGGVGTSLDVKADQLALYFNENKLYFDFSTHNDLRVGM